MPIYHHTGPRLSRSERKRRHRRQAAFKLLAILLGGLSLGSFLYFRWSDRQPVARRPDTSPESQPTIHLGGATEVMVQRLARGVETINVSRHPYMNAERATALREILAAATGRRERSSLTYELAIELLRAGQLTEALAAWNQFEQMASEPGYPITPEMRAVARDLAAIASLRLADQQDRTAGMGVDRFLIPRVVDAPVPANHPVRSAIERYTGILNNQPGDLRARWLLNVGCMMAGEYPSGVPAAWLIPPAAFNSEHDIGRFREIAREAGVRVNRSAGGCILEDFDGDGYLDLMVSSMGPRDPLRLLLNNGDGTFQDYTRQAGLADLTGGISLCRGDYNNDGYPDVFVSRGGGFGREGRTPNSLLRNNGDGTFDDVTDEAGLLSFRPTFAAAWLDYNNDGHLDLFVANESRADDSHPCELFRNQGDGTFVECAAAAGVNLRKNVRAIACGDYNNDGLVDLYLAVAGETNVLLRNEGLSGGDPSLLPGRSGSDGPPWRFADVTAAARVGEPTEASAAWFWDYDNDGRLDLLVLSAGGTVADLAASYLHMSHAGSTPRLYHNNADGSFTDITTLVRLDKPLLASGGGFADLDNDGFLEFIALTGSTDPECIVPHRVFRNDSGRRFQDITTSAGLGHSSPAMAVAFGDVDADGDRDIYIAAGGPHAGEAAPGLLFDNPGQPCHWISLKLVGVRSNRSAIGARIRIHVETEDRDRDIRCIVGFDGGSSLQQVIGLGAATRISYIDVHWPTSGIRQRFENAPMDRAFRIREDQQELSAD